MSGIPMFQFMVAPLEDISDNAFRTICHRYGADLTFTEMIRLEGLARKNASTWSRLNFNDDTPTFVQIIGSKDDNLDKFLKEFNPPKCVKGINLNLGCPSPPMVRLGLGCAMIKRIRKTSELVKIIHKHDLQASIKMRLGMNQYEKEKKVYLNFIKSVDADFFVVHVRHGGENYNNPPDYDALPECVATGKRIIANGNINTKEKIDMLKKMGVSGAMIGREAVVNPAIFNILQGKEAPILEQIKKEYLELAEKFDSPFRYRKNFLKHIGIKDNNSQDYGSNLG